MNLCFIEKTFNKSALANKQVILAAKNDGVYLDDTLQFKYDTIKKVAILDNAIVVYHNIGTIYLPNKAFSNKKDRTLFIDLI